MTRIRWFAQQEAIELLHLESVRAQNDKDDDVVWELLTDLGKVGSQSVHKTYLVVMPILRA